MKGKNIKTILKHIAIVVEFVLIFQYAGLLAPILKTTALTVTSKEITWDYEIENENAVNVGIDTSMTNIKGEVTIPDTLDGYAVTSIKTKAFSGYEGITKINIPSTVTSIGNNAFENCTALESVVIPDGVTTIQTLTFSNCINLTSITIPNSVTNIDALAFQGCSNLVIKCDENSFAYKYANDNNISTQIFERETETRVADATADMVVDETEYTTENTTADTTDNATAEAVAIRKDGKVYIYSNSEGTIQYSVTSDVNLENYVIPFENSDATSIFVKVGDNEKKEITIKNIAENKIFDVKTSNDVFTIMSEPRYIATHSTNAPRAVRRDGIITINDMIYTGKCEITYDLLDGKGFQEYTYSSGETDIKIENIDSDEIVIYRKTDYDVTTGTYTFKIADYDKLGEIFGLYNENGNSYVFRQNRELEKNDDNILITNDENKIERFDEAGQILNVTKVAGDVLILKSDGKVYKVKDSNYSLELISGSNNFTNISGSYAIDANKTVWKCNYNSTDKKYQYEESNKYSIKQDENITKIVGTAEGLYILYSNGEAIFYKDDGTNVTISNMAMDISASGQDKYALEYNKVKYIGNFTNSEKDLSTILNSEEFIIGINNNGAILTNSGKLYKPEFGYVASWHYLYSYSEEPTKTGIKKLGDYTYQDNSGRVYYLENDTEIEKKVNNITITKDESNLNQNKVSIKVEVPSNTYTITKPDKTTSTDSIITYEVTENGVYTFEFKDKSGYTVTRVVHVTNIQNRKETKVPEVTALNGKIKLESDEKIEYSTDLQNWTEYTSEIEYNTTIYARIKSDEFECSILKIAIDENGKLDVVNTEKREIQGEILTNGVGQVEKGAINKSIQFDEEVKANVGSDSTNENKGLFNYLSKIAENIIYSFSATDKVYSGQSGSWNAPEHNATEVTYKNLDNDYVGMQEGGLTASKIANNATNKDYSILSVTYNYSYNVTEDEEKQKIENGTIYKYEPNMVKNNDPDSEEYGKYVQNGWKETIAKYAYIDNKGDIYSNIEAINKAINKIGNNTKYTKIVGDGSTFYILTQEGSVYMVTDGATNDGNVGSTAYLLEKLNAVKVYEEMVNGKKENYIYCPSLYRTYIVYKLELKDIVDIYDSCTALTKDGNVISLLADNQSETSVVQELQKQTDKYLVASHLGLKDGKLYNFNDVYNGYEVTAGKLVKSDTPKYGKYSESNKTITLFETLYNSDGSLLNTNKSDDEIYFDVEASEEKLPKFIDIAEHTESFLTSHEQYSWNPNNGSWKAEIDNNEKANQYARCYAITAEGEIWTYIGGYIVDTGINLDYFGPTANYNLSTNNWTNKNINLNFSENTTSKVVNVIVKVGESILSEIKNKDVGTESSPVSIEKNGEYTIDVTDSKGRKYTSNVNVGNIDKLEPIVQFSGEIINGIANITAYDQDATADYAKSGIARIEMTYDNPTENTKWTEVDGQTDAQGNVSASIELTQENNVAYIRAIDNAGNISKTTTITLDEEEKQNGKVIVKYQDEEGNSLKDDLIITDTVGEDYEVSSSEIYAYKLVEVLGNEKGKFTEEDQVVIYKYEKITGRIIIIYQDPDGNKIQEDTIITGKVDEPYKVDRQEIDGYELIEVIGDEEGKYKIEDQYVMYKYKKLEIPTIPQTGQARTMYLIIGLIIIVCIGGLSYIEVLKQK